VASGECIVDTRLCFYLLIVEHIVDSTNVPSSKYKTWKIVCVCFRVGIVVMTLKPAILRLNLFRLELCIAILCAMPTLQFL
jgi:hypothetical protein